MAFVASELFRQDFVATDFVVVPHNQGIEYPAVRVIVGDIFRPDLLRNLRVDASDPTNRLAVELIGAQTGTVQVLSYDFQAVGILSASTLASLGLGGIFVLGEEYAYAEDLTPSSTNSTTFVQKLRLSVTGVPAGTYHVACSFTWNLNDTVDDFDARLQIDDTDTVWGMMAEPSDASSDQENSGQGLAHVVLTAGDHDIDLDFATDNAATTARINQARIEFWRIE